MAEVNKKLTPFQQEMLETFQKLKEYKLPSESNVVAILYKEPSRIFNTNLCTEEFSNNIWRVYFEIIHELVLKEGKEKITDIEIGIYLDKHDKLRQKYEEYGGYSTIEKISEYIESENFDSHLNNMRKWGVLMNLCKKGFPVKKNLSHYADMSAEEIYDEWEVFLNDTFVNIESNVKSYDITYNIDELIEKLDEGYALGLPYYGMDMLSAETGGQYLGSITLVGGLSNVGKSTIVRSLILPTIINSDEKICIMINEDSLQKWQRELLVWICNNILKFDIQKHTVRNGHFESTVKEKLYEASEWLKEKTQNHKITVIPFQSYKNDIAIKTIKKYAALGVNYFILDTFKMDAGKVTPQSWQEMSQNMVAINDVIKSEVLNVHIAITFQLEKGSAIQRYYTQYNIGVSKNMVDVASTCIMIRDVFADEYTNEKRALKVYKLAGEKNETKIGVPLKQGKSYQVFFIVKNREGSANSYQIVAEHDKSRNLIQEVGITNIRPDGF